MLKRWEVLDMCSRITKFVGVPKCDENVTGCKMAELGCGYDI